MRPMPLATEDGQGALAPGWRGRRAWLRRAGALLAWGALLALALPRLQPPAPRPAPASGEAATKTATYHVNIDTRVLSEEEERAQVERRLPSLPLHYWHRNKDNKNKYYKKKGCASFPSIYELELHNTYWQTLRTSNGTFYLYGAYLDARNASRYRSVRVLAVHDRLKPSVVTHCQLWFEGRNAPVIVRNLEYKYMWLKNWGNYHDHVLQPYLLTCVLPAVVRHLPLAAVSLVERSCDCAPNALRVHNRRPLGPRKQFAVCVKGLDFQHEDFSVRLVEWIELIRLLGADKIFFYELQVHPNITKVLDYYRERGVVTVTPITLPGGQPNLPGLQHMYLKKKTTHKRQMELIPYNDCLYRHMYEYRWLALLDVDEVIVPLEDPDWPSLMRRVLPLATPAAGKPPRSSYHASNLYFLDSLRHEHGWEEGVPRHLHMLQHVYRTRNFTKPMRYVKSFFETDRVLVVHNHFPLVCLGSKCNSYPLETRHARLQHYRADCVSSLKKSCEELRVDPVRDTALWRWRERLAAAADTVLRRLGFLPRAAVAPVFR